MPDQCRRCLDFWLNDLGHSDGTESFRFRYAMRPRQDWNFWIEVVDATHCQRGGLNFRQGYDD